MVSLTLALYLHFLNLCVPGQKSLFSMKIIHFERTAASILEITATNPQSIGNFSSLIWERGEKSIATYSVSQCLITRYWCIDTEQEVICVSSQFLPLFSQLNMLTWQKNFVSLTHALKSSSGGLFLFH